MSAKNQVIQACPHCSGTAGYYRKVTMTGVGRRNYGFDGSVDDNTSLMDDFTENEKKRMYCQDFHESVGIFNE